MPEIPILIAMRFTTLLIFINCIAWGVAWIAKNRKEWMYAFPVMVVFCHAVVYYSVYLLDWFNSVSQPFNLQFYADWGSLFVMHVGFTSLIVVIDLVTSVFTKGMIRYFPGLVGYE